MGAVEHVVAVVNIVDVNLIRAVPGRSPGLRARVHHGEPESAELEARGAFDDHHRHVVHAEPVSAPEMGVETLRRNAISAIAAAFAPGAMLTIPVVGALTLPDVLLGVPHLRLWTSDFVRLNPAMLSV